MRARTVLAVVLILGVLVGALAVGLSASGSAGGSLKLHWLSSTAVPVDGNHHAVAAGRVDGQGMVYAPVSGQHNTSQCRLVALTADQGIERWHRSIPPADCWIHSVATLRLADVNGDGTPEVISPTTEDMVYALAPLSGHVELSHPLASYGYSEAAVGHLTNGSAEQIAVVDAKGTTFVIYPNGTTAWRRRVDSYVWATPAIDDFAGNGRNQLAVGYGKGIVTVYRGDGSIRWNRTLPDDGSLTWMTTADLNGDGATDVIPATDAGVVYALSGRDGHVLWSRDLGAYAAVTAVGDGNGDGVPEVYATARDGKLRALSGRDGTTEWTTTLSTGKVQMTPPATMGDVSGDGTPEIVAVTNSGVVDVVDPASGGVLASYKRNVPIWERATLADTNGDGVDEIYVMYGDGRVAALSYQSG